MKLSDNRTSWRKAVRNGAARMRLGVIALVAVSGCLSQAASGNPQITSVQFSGSSGNYTLTVNGSGFGTLPSSLPFSGDSSYFRIADAAQLGFGEWGYSGDALGLAYQSWSDTQIQVSGFGGQPGDAIVLAAWNPSSGLGATWGGNVPGGGAGTPQITSVTFSGAGQNVQITINGSGFGSAPVTVPFTGDLNQFSFGDFRTHCGGGSSLFEAGASRWGHGSPDSLTLNYQSWSDNEIVITGFSGSYGQGCDTVQAGDPVAIVVWNTSDTSQTGPQTAWGGFMTETADTIFLFTPCVNGLQVDLNGGVYPSSSGASATNLVWDWGDGQQTNAPFVISHVYSSAGQYTIQVTAYYSDGTTASTSQTANVGPGVLSSCESLTITAEQGGSVSYQASVGSGAVSEGGSITLQLAYADDLSLTATPCSRNFFSDWSASSGITGLGGAPVPTSSTSITIVVADDSQITGSFLSPYGVESAANWSGYVVGMPDASGTYQSDAVSDVKGTWVIPEVQNFSRGEGFATWIGIGGLTDPPTLTGNVPLVQIGTALTYTTGRYYAWYEVINVLGGGPVIRFPAFPVNPGDIISAEVSFVGKRPLNPYYGWYKLTIDNVSRGVSRTHYVLAPFNTRKTAEWIVEDPLFKLPPLADFGIVKFSDCSVSLNSEEGPITSSGGGFSLAMTNNNGAIQAEPSPVSCDGTGFSVIWRHK